MVALAVAVVASAWIIGTQAQDIDGYHPHAVFAFIRTGERTPTIRPGSPVLTALGADQMYTLGQNFRTRYVTGNSPNGLGQEHMTGLSPDIVDNDQILIKTLDTPYLVSAAQAFGQGLYPPHTSGNGTGNALANGKTVNYPLNGYQYASIQSTGELDAESRFVSGAQNCPIAQRDAMMYFTTDDFLETKAANKDFYASLHADWFEGNLKDGELGYISALEIADYLTYQYAHNSSIYHTLANDSSYTGVYNKVHQLADQEAWYLYGNTTSSSTDADNQAIPGKTLANAIVTQFEKLVSDKIGGGGDTADISYPLTFYLGEQGPMMSLISLMMADYHDENFRSIPPFASAMIFELFSTGANASFPSNKDDLWIRFYFHNGTIYDNEGPTAYPFFGNGPSKYEMQWLEFQDMFTRIGMNTLTEWCETCASPSLFCWGVEKANTTPSLSVQENKHKVTPAVAGVIGAIVTLAVAGILFGLAMLLGGVRLHRNTRRDKRQSALGGFKGSAKLASDPDLSLAGNAAAPAGVSFVGGGAGVGAGDTKKGHERVGSWELRQKEFGTGYSADQSRRGSLDAIDAVAGRPVEPHERV